MDQYTRETLYIPQGLKHKKEFFSGFGKDEAIKAVIGLVFFALVEIPIYLITKQISLVMATYIFFGFAIVGALVNDPSTNLSALKIVQNIFRFSKSQKHFPYKGLKEWRDF